MAVITPFKGVRYNPERFKDLSLVISQPYDRVRYGLQDKYYDQSDHTIVKIIKGREFDSDNDKNNVYTRARDYMRNWLADGALLREEQPAIYVLHQTFDVDGQPYTRKAFITALELTTFDEGVVLPHERTLSGPKVDRLNLTRATETYFGQIFMLYPDDENKVNALLDAAIAGQKPLAARELFESDVEQKLWVLTDPDVLAQVQAEMAPKVNLIIADGHHRYETAINYRNEMRAKHPDAPAEAGFNYRMVTLVSQSDPGLVILPTHRMIHSYKAKSSQQVLADIKEYFVVEQVADQATLEAALAEANPQASRIGFYDGDYYSLTLKGLHVMTKLLPDRHPSWCELDVSVLHELLLERVLGLSRESVERKENIDYLRDVNMGYEQVDLEQANFIFVLNPTRMPQVRACTGFDEKMPQKSTDFYPKVLTGFVALPVNLQEIL